MHCWKLEVPYDVIKQAYPWRSISSSDARVVERLALEAFKKNLMYAREWPRCSTHWNEGLSRYVAFGSSSCWALLSCEKCGVRAVDDNGYTYFSLEELREK